MKMEPSNVDGQVVEKRVHRVDWKVNVSHIMLAVAVAGVVYWLWSKGITAGSSSSDDVEAEVENREFVDVQLQGGLAR